MSKINFVRKIFSGFKVPNKPNALTIEDWQKWEEESKEKYPVRYFLSETSPKYFRRVYRNVSDVVYFIKCHTLKKYRFHYLDLRQPNKPPMYYKYGWIDSDHQILCACFNVLVNFIEKEYKGVEDYISKCIKDCSDPQILADRKEIVKIYIWWSKERDQILEKCDQVYCKLSNDFEKNYTNFSKEERDIVSETIKIKNEVAELDQAMLLQLISLRKHLCS